MSSHERQRPQLDIFMIFMLHRHHHRSWETEDARDKISLCSPIMHVLLLYEREYDNIVNPSISRRFFRWDNGWIYYDVWLDEDWAPSSNSYFIVYGLMRNYIQLYAIWGEIMLQQSAFMREILCSARSLCESWVKKWKIIEKLTAQQPATGVLWRHLTSHAKQLRISEIFLFSIVPCARLET